jgi:hypothetical protein
VKNLFSFFDVTCTLTISYSHKDEDWKDRFVEQLRVLQKEGLFNVWEDRQIGAGDNWKEQIEDALNSCQVAVLMITASLLTSDFILRDEVTKLLKRREKEGVRIIPLIVRDCPWEEVRWLSPIQARPKDGRPLSGMAEHEADTAMSALVRELAGLIKDGTETTTSKLLPLNGDQGRVSDQDSKDLSQAGHCKASDGEAARKRLVMLRELQASLISEDEWKCLPEELAESLASRVNGRVCAGRECKTCVAKCMVPLLGIPRLEEVINHIFERKDEIVLLYGSQLSGKTVSSEGFEVRSLACGGHRVRVLSTTPVDLRLAAQPILEAEASKAMLAQMEGVDVTLLVMLACFAQKAVLQLIDDRTYCDSAADERFGAAKFNVQDAKCYIEDMYQILPDPGGGRIDTLEYFDALMTSVIRILLLLGAYDRTIRLILHLDDAHRLETEYAILPGAIPEEDLDSVFAQWRKPSMHGGALLRRRHARKPREDVSLFITARQLLPVVVGSGGEASHVVDVTVVNQIQKEDIDHFFDRWSCFAKPLEASDVALISARIHRATRGYPWFVHRYLRALASLLNNTRGLSLSKIGSVIENSQFIWFSKAPFAEHHTFTGELREEIRATEENEPYMASDPSLFADNALLRPKAQQAWNDVGHCLNAQSVSDPAEDEAIKNIKDEELAKSVLPLVQAGVILARTTANSNFVAANKIVKNIFIPNAKMRLSHAE